MMDKTDMYNIVKLDDESVTSLSHLKLFSYHKNARDNLIVH